MEERRVLYVRHRERELAYSKAYYEEHKEEINEKDKVRGAIYRAANIDKVREKNRLCRKNYIAANIEKVNEYNNTQHNCECGGHYSNKHKCVHDKGKKHIKFMEAKNAPLPPRIESHLEK